MQQYPDHLPNYKAITINNPLVHLLVPKKRILTINDLNAADAEIISRLFLATKALAAQYKIDESGYRLAVNTNKDAGQSVFHIHTHLLGGIKLSPMMSQTYQGKEKE
ncbi:MAG: HIT domain-containing protein [Bacteroidota bacterium]